jgi:hypothetical protein
MESSKMRGRSLGIDEASQREDKEISRLRGSSVGCDAVCQREGGRSRLGG